MIDATAADDQARIRCAAFEAAYLDMTPPDPASHRFALLVARHEERLLQERVVMGGPANPLLTDGGTAGPFDSA